MKNKKLWATLLAAAMMTTVMEVLPAQMTGKKRISCTRRDFPLWMQGIIRFLCL